MDKLLNYLVKGLDVLQELNIGLKPSVLLSSWTLQWEDVNSWNNLNS